MKLFKHTLFGLLYILSISAYAQVQVSQKTLEEMAKKYGNGRYIEPDASTGSSEDSKLNPIILKGEKTKYRSLEEATMDVDRILNEINNEQYDNKPNNESLSFRLSQRNRRNLKKDKVANDVWEDIITESNPSVQDLVDLKAKFGNKPTYYVNGVEVDQLILDKLRPTDVIAREVRVLNTQSGNPNGEIWYDIKEAALAKIKVNEYGGKKAMPDEIMEIEVNSKYTPTSIEDIEGTKSVRGKEYRQISKSAKESNNIQKDVEEQSNIDRVQISSKSLEFIEKEVQAKEQENSQPEQTQEKVTPNTNERPSRLKKVRN